MTLLSICQAIADTTHGPRPATIATNTNPDAQNYLRIVNKVGTKLMKVYPWNILRKEHTFTAPGTETLVAAASMPSDFDRFVPETFWNRSTNNLISGPIGATEWQGLKVLDTTIPNYKFTFRGGNILSIPTISSSSSCAFEYISNQWCESAAGAGKTAFSVDTDVGVLDEELLTLAATYAWLAAEGQPVQGAWQDFKDYFDTLQGNENATENILVTADIFGRFTRHFDGTPMASRSPLFYGGS